MTDHKPLQQHDVTLAAGRPSHGGQIPPSQHSDLTAKLLSSQLTTAPVRSELTVLILTLPTEHSPVRLHEAGLELDVGGGEEAAPGPLADCAAAVPAPALLQNVHRVPHTQRQTMAHAARPAVHG